MGAPGPQDYRQFEVIAFWIVVATGALLVGIGAVIGYLAS